MAEEQVSTESTSKINLIDENLFQLKCLLRANGIGHSARCEIGKKHLLAFSTTCTDIGLYYHENIHRVASVKRIPWFQAPQRTICALCFDPTGSWLLVASIDGSLYIVPALALVDPSATVDHRWTINDLTCFTSLNLQSSYSRPTCLTWWQGITQCSHIGIIGTERGEIVFVNLENGQQVGLTRTNCGVISSLHICQDNSLEFVSLLITNQSRRQWRLILEQRTTNYVYPLSNVSRSPVGQVCSVERSGESFDDGKSFPPARSRLQGLKQLSVEKLAVLKQKLAESRNRNLAGNTRRQDSGSSSGTDETSTPEHTSRSFDEKIDTLTPQLLSSDRFLLPQYTRQGQHLYIGYNDATNDITIHGTDISMIPLCMYKMSGPCHDVLLTQRLFFTVSPNRRTLSIISCPLSEGRFDEEFEFNKESLIARFDIEDSNEFISNVYRSTDYKKPTSDEEPRNLENVYSLPSRVEDLRVDVPLVDTCIVVTNFAVYKVVLRRSLLNVFMDFVLKKNDLERARKLDVVFGMNIQQLLEFAGDIFLMNNDCSKAVVLYKLSRCRLLKRVLKFAAAGKSAKLLGWLMQCLVAPAVSELPTATRIHLSNLSVLTFTELTLRATAQELNSMNKAFLLFLSTNTFYDELWAVDIAGQTCLWKVLHHLATQRGLFAQVLEILIKAVQSINSNNSCLMSPQSKYCLLICISEPGLVQAILANPIVIARSHIEFVAASLSTLPVFVLQRLVSLYDPTNPALRPLLVRSRARRRTMSQGSQSSQCDSLDSTDVLEDANTLVEEVVETFLLILSNLVHKNTPLRSFNPTFMQRINLPGIEKRCDGKTTNADFKRRLLSAGFGHVALIRNGNVFTWGNAANGCLGTGPSISRYGSPHPVCLFRNMEMEVLSVSCGRVHSLAVTNNGVYAWGASKFGQLGLGRILQCPSPELIVSLAQEIIVDAVAGQYHSVALTNDGRVFTWGWGVHGQLGHGDTNPKNIPCLVKYLLGTVIRHVSAGHAHTIALSEDGYVYAFGCNTFGQLGNDDNLKSSVPIKVSLLPEKITNIATAYFHNLAVSNTNKLYTWGASPQVLRLQSQAQKKSKIREFQAAMDKFAEQDSEARSSSNGNGDANDQNNSSNLDDNSDNDEAKNDSMNSSKLQKRIALAKTLKSRDINLGMLEEAHTHLKPALVDTDSVNGKIVQISTGCHHSALLTRDGTVYTWGRNLDGQIGNGSRCEVPTPTPLDYNPVSVLAQIPPRSRNYKSDEMPDISGNSDFNTLGFEELSLENDNSNSRRASNRMIKTVRVCCGCDFTVAIQPGGTVLAWGSNSMAQLGRPPTKDAAADEKLVLLKSSGRVVRLPHGANVACDTPSQVPNIPTPIISYRSYDIPPLAGRVRPLSVVEKSIGELTLHYVLEQFHGLYDSNKIMDKFLEIGDFQACSKIALLEQNQPKSFAYQLKSLNPSSYKNRTEVCSPEENASEYENDKLSPEIVEENNDNDSTPEIEHVKENTELFDKQVAQNLVDSLEESVTKSKIKMSTSRSLDSFQVLEDGLHNFDCQGGSEELCEDAKSDDFSLDLTEDTLDNETEENHVEFNKNLDRMRDLLVGQNSCKRESSQINGGSEEVDQENSSRQIAPASDEKNTRQRDITNNLVDNDMKDLLSDASRIMQFYMNEIDAGAHAIMSEVLHTALEFWSEHELPIDTLEKVLLKHINKLFYPLGLLLFCQNSGGKNVDANKNSAEIKSLRAMNSLSTKFCLQVCSMLLQHVDQGKPTTEYIELFSMLTAKHYGPPLTGFPGSSENRTSDQMMEGIINTISTKNGDPQPFIHIKDPEQVKRLVESDEDTIVFTCGHHFPLSAYKNSAIPNMEAELLMSQPVPLPHTAQLLGNMLSRDARIESMCPMCVPRALQNAIDNLMDR